MAHDTDDRPKDQPFRGEDARDRGGVPSPRQKGAEDERDQAETPGDPVVENRRDIPGGSFRPARTPGATGPTTRER